jgi:hypothetical protein
MIGKGFIMEIMKFERITLGSTESRFLIRIGFTGSESAYSICSFLREEPPDWVEKSSIIRPMSYKNVHKRVKKLESLRLIEKIPGKELPHKAIKYRLTSRGLFQCLQEGMVSAVIVMTDANNRYKENIFLKTILYQFFSQETIKHFDTPLRLFALGNYLQSCSQAILSKIEAYRSSRFQDKQRWLADDIGYIIRNEIRKFAFNIVTNVNTKRIMIPMLDDDNNEYARRGIDLAENHNADHRTFYPNFALAKDKKFTKLLNEIKMNFDDGYKMFSSIASN